MMPLVVRMEPRNGEEKNIVKIQRRLPILGLWSLLVHWVSMKQMGHGCEPIHHQVMTIVW